MPAPNEHPPMATHLEVEPYDDSERVQPPEWYDDTINVGDVANAEAER